MARTIPGPTPTGEDGAATGKLPLGAPWITTAGTEIPLPTGRKKLLAMLFAVGLGVIPVVNWRPKYRTLPRVVSVRKSVILRVHVPLRAPAAATCFKKVFSEPNSGRKWPTYGAAFPFVPVVVESKMFLVALSSKTVAMSFGMNELEMSSPK